jgi:hypothetical protein
LEALDDEAKNFEGKIGKHGRMIRNLKYAVESSDEAGVSAEVDGEEERQGGINRRNLFETYCAVYLTLCI